MASVPHLVAVTPDGAYPEVLSALLARHQSLQIVRIQFTPVKDPLRDSSGQMVKLLRPFIGKCSHALVIRDLEGSGFEKDGAGALEAKLTAELVANGWTAGHSAAIVVDPEIEDWLRLPSPHLEKLVKERARRNKGMSASSQDFHKILASAFQRHGGRDERDKPVRPKEVFEDFLRTFGIPRTNALYGVLARSESVEHCRSGSFNRFVTLMRKWFSR